MSVSRGAVLLGPGTNLAGSFMHAGQDGTIAGVTAYGYARTTGEPGEVFTDPFDGALDTVDRWTTGGTVAPTVTGGSASVTPGATTASASSSLVSRATFSPRGQNFRSLGMVARFENAGAASGQLFFLNNHRFIGLATAPGTWQAAIGVAGTSGPVLDGIGFEIGTDGAMYPVVYQNGTRVVATILSGAANLNVGRTLANGSWHQLAVVTRSDAVFWYIDGLTSPVAVFSYSTATYVIPNQQILPIRLHSINATTAATGVPVFQFAALALGDTGAGGKSIVDGRFPWREAGVTDVSVITGALQPAAREQAAGSALNVNTNAVQLATYRAIAKPTAAALTAGTLSFRCSLHHLATSTKTVRIRRIIVSALMSAIAEGSQIEVHRVTAAPTGAAVTGGSATASNIAADTRDVAPEATFLNSLTAATSAGLLASAFLAQSSAAALHGGGQVIYDWQEAGQTKPITLRAGVLEGIAIGVVSNAAVVPTLTIDIVYTEE